MYSPVFVPGVLTCTRLCVSVHGEWPNGPHTVVVEGDPMWGVLSGLSQPR